MNAMKWCFGAASALMMAIPMTADAQNRQTRQRLDTIEQQLLDLQGSVYGEASASGANVRYQGANPNPSAQVSVGSGADFAVRIGALESEIQRLTGEVERLTFDLRQQQEMFNRFLETANPEFLNAMSSADGPAPTSNGGSNVSGPIDLIGGQEPEDGGFKDPDTAFRAGRNALLEARYDEAELAFVTLIDDFPNDALAPDATFYLGETYLAQGDLGASARTFLDFIRTYPDNERAPEAHLKLGQAFARADKRNEACRVWERGLNNYRRMDGDMRRRISDVQESTCS